MRFFGTPAWLGAGWLAGVLSGVTTPNDGPITSRLQAAGCWLAVWLAGRLLVGRLAGLVGFLNCWINRLQHNKKEV